jgi:hypothetical protein
MSKPVIFTISAAWDREASVWSGHCDDIPAAADAPTLDELLEKISAMALDLLPDNHPDLAPESLFLQGRRSHEIWHSPITKRNFAVPIGIPSRHTANAILRQAGLPKAF